MTANDNLIQDLGGRGEKLLVDNLHEKEKVLVKLKGTFGEGLVITDKKLYVLKWGYMAGNLIGGRCNAFEYGSITGLEIKKNLLTGTFEVLTSAMQNAQKSYWGKGNEDAIKSDNIVTIQRQMFDLFQEAVKIGREQISKFHSGHGRRDSDLSDLEKLAELKEKGIITQKEFNAKKKSILGL